MKVVTICCYAVTLWALGWGILGINQYLNQELESAARFSPVHLRLAVQQ